MSDVVARAHRVANWCRASRDQQLTRDLALVVVRVALVWIFVYHGASTLFGAFHGGGIHGEAVYFSNTVHLHPGTFFAVLDGSIQFFGGIGIGVGVLGRVAAISIAGDMIMAMITVTGAQGLVGVAGGVGYQLNLALAVLALVIAFLGTGRFSLDAQVEKVIERRRGRVTTMSVPSQ